MLDKRRRRKQAAYFSDAADVDGAASVVVDRAPTANATDAVLVPVTNAKAAASVELDPATIKIIDIMVKTPFQVVYRGDIAVCVMLIASSCAYVLQYQGKRVPVMVASHNSRTSDTASRRLQIEMQILRTIKPHSNIVQYVQ